MVNELSNFGQGFYPPACIYSLTGIMGKSLDFTLNIHIFCYITDTDGRCKVMNLGRLWICLVGITPSNNPGTEREILPYMVRDSPYIALHGNPTGHGIQFWGKGILSVHQICLNNSYCHCKSMELRVGHFQTTTVKT